jgi:Bacterial SH3 domain
VSRHLLLIIATLFLAEVSVSQDAELHAGSATVKRLTVLRAQPKNSGPVLARLNPDTTVRWIENQKDGGFLRVIGTKGPQGWVRASAVEATAQTASEILAAAPPCAGGLDACPTKGCAVSGSAKALANEAKRKVPPEGPPPTTLTLSDFAALQEQADGLVGEGSEIPDRSLLRDLAVAEGTVSEGSLVQLVGFIAEGLEPHANTGESVNCRLRAKADNDFHINVAENTGEDEFSGVVVEMIPQDRSPSWTLAKLKTLQARKRMVKVVGGLFYDEAHIVNADPSHPVPGQPKRISLWEIHPIQKFLVCNKTTGSCDPTDDSQWTPL